MMFKEIFRLFEKVSRDCSNGPGIVPDGPYKGWELIRTSHLDEPRKNGKERDHDWNCQSFDNLVTKFLQKRPLGINDGKYTLTWKNSDGYQSCIVSVDNSRKSITFVTIMMLNKKSTRDYTKVGSTLINLGVIQLP
jgi:hypothetical protein